MRLYQLHLTCPQHIPNIFLELIHLFLKLPTSVSLNMPAHYKFPILLCVLNFHSLHEGACTVFIPHISLLKTTAHIADGLKWENHSSIKKTAILLQNHASSTNLYRVELSVNIEQLNEIFTFWSEKSSLYIYGKLIVKKVSFTFVFSSNKGTY